MCVSLASQDRGFFKKKNKIKKKNGKERSKSTYTISSITPFVLLFPTVFVPLNISNIMFATRFDPLGGKIPAKRASKDDNDEEKRKKARKEPDVKVRKSAHRHKKEHHKKTEQLKKEKSDFSKDIGANEKDDVEKDESAKLEKDDDGDIIMSSEEESSIDKAIIQTKSKAKSAALRRYKRALEMQDKITDDAKVTSENAAPETDLAEIRNVAPMPQPKLPRDRNLASQAAKNKNLQWLAKPNYHATDIKQRFDSLEPKLDEKLVSNLKTEFGIEEAFSVQVNVIQSIMNAVTKNRLDPRPYGDYLVNAATGSGKTLAYLIPVVEALKNRVVPRVRCIILAPTKPLVNQVYLTLLKLTKGFDLNIIALRSGESLRIEHDRFVNNHPDIIVATPGRLVDHISKFNLDLSQLRFLVVDEADRLLNQSFQNWCDVLVGKIEEEQEDDQDSNSFYNKFKIRCVKVILSATLTTNSEKLLHLKLFKPNLVVINNSEELVHELYQLPPHLEEYYINIPEALSFYKPLIFLRFLLDQPDLIDHGLIFTKSNETAVRLSRLLQLLSSDSNQKLSVLCINSATKSSQKRKILKEFDINGGVLIATDLMSRGLNFDSIKFVVNYDLPLSTKEYIHRVGRTARANKQGRAFSFCFGEGDFRWFKKLVFSGGVINRNGKDVHQIKFIRRDEITGNGAEFALDLGDDDKTHYDSCLGKLKDEVLG